MGTWVFPESPTFQRIDIDFVRNLLSINIGSKFETYMTSQVTYCDSGNFPRT